MCFDNKGNGEDVSDGKKPHVKHILQAMDDVLRVFCRNETHSGCFTDKKRTESEKFWSCTSGRPTSQSLKSESIASETGLTAKRRVIAFCE